MIDATEEVGAAYESLYSVLAHLARRNFRIPEDDIKPIVHEVFVAFIRNRSRVENQRRWLIGAVCISCRNYWRRSGRRDDAMGTLAREMAPGAIADRLTERLDAATILRRLPRRCRDVLRLRFFENYTASALAQRYATTVAYARRMVYRCLISARTLFDSEGGK